MVQPPASAADTSAKTSGTGIFTIINCCLLVGLWAFVVMVPPALHSLFEGLGDELPRVAILLINISHKPMGLLVGILVAVAAMVILEVLVHERKSRLVVNRACLALVILTYAAITLTMFLPVYAARQAMN